MAGGDKARRKSVCARRGAHVFAIKKFFCEVSHTGVELGVGLCDPIGFMERCRCPKGFYADDSIFLGQIRSLGAARIYEDVVVGAVPSPVRASWTAFGPATAIHCNLQKGPSTGILPFRAEPSFLPPRFSVLCYAPPVSTNLHMSHFYKAR